MTFRIDVAPLAVPNGTLPTTARAGTPQRGPQQQVLRLLLTSASQACLARIADTGPTSGCAAQPAQEHAPGRLRRSDAPAAHRGASVDTRSVGQRPADGGTSRGASIDDPWRLPAARVESMRPAPTGPASLQRPGNDEVVAILGRHEGRFRNATPEALRKMADDPGTPPDLRRGLEALLGNNGLRQRLMPGGKLSAGSINAAQDLPGQKAYAEGEAREYTRNYLPSDNADPGSGPRPMTSNDAMRELFKYSDQLPKHVSREKLKDIANGSAAVGQCTPQLQAAARFYVDHPDAWKRDFGCEPDKSIRKDGLLNNSDDKIQLTQKEHDTLDVISRHRDTFFGGKSLTPDKLERIANDEKADPTLRDAARELHGNKMLFSMLDNGKHQHGGNIIHPANDKKISRGDLDAWLGKMNKTVASERASAATAPWEFSIAATRDMLEGQYNAPDFKAKKGGGLADFGAGLLKGFGVVAGIASSALGAVANLKIPGLSWIAGAGAVGLSMMEGGAKVGATAIQGGDVKQEGIAAGIGTASTLVGLIGGRGASKAAKEGLDMAADQGRKSAQRWSDKAVNKKTDITNGEAAQAAGLGGAKAAATQAASHGGKEVHARTGTEVAADGGVPAQQQVDAQLQRIAGRYGHA